MALDEIDGRQKTCSLQPAPIEIVGRYVRSCDERDAAAEEGIEQVAQDHGVGDVGHEELIEADHARLRGKLCCDGLKWILLMAQRLQSSMDAIHQAVKVIPQ